MKFNLGLLLMVVFLFEGTSVLACVDLSGHYSATNSAAKTDLIIKQRGCSQITEYKKYTFPDGNIQEGTLTYAIDGVPAKLGEYEDPTDYISSTFSGDVLVKRYLFVWTKTEKKVTSAIEIVNLTPDKNYHRIYTFFGETGLKEIVADEVLLRQQ